MVKTISFLIACAILALALFSFGCGGSSQSKAEALATPTPKPSATPTPFKHFVDDEVTKFQKDFARISVDDATVLKQIAETDSKSAAMRRAYADFLDAERLEEARNAKWGDELSFLSREESIALAKKRLLLFGTWALLAARDPQEIPWLTTRENQQVSNISEDEILYLLSEKMSDRNILLKEIGTTPQELRSLSLGAAKDFAEFLKEDLHEKDDDPTDDYSPAKVARKNWENWKNPWKFSFEQIGLSNRDVDLLYTP